MSSLCTVVVNGKQSLHHLCSKQYRDLNLSQFLYIFGQNIIYIAKIILVEIKY